MQRFLCCVTAPPTTTTDTPTTDTPTTINDNTPTTTADTASSDGQPQQCHTVMISALYIAT